MVSKGCFSSSLNACTINAPKKSPILSGVAGSGDVATDFAVGFPLSPCGVSWIFSIEKQVFSIGVTSEAWCPHKEGCVGVAAVLGLFPETLGTPGPLLSSADPDAVVKQRDWES